MVGITLQVSVSISLLSLPQRIWEGEGKKQVSEEIRAGGGGEEM